MFTRATTSQDNKFSLNMNQHTPFLHTFHFNYFVIIIVIIHNILYGNRNFSFNDMSLRYQLYISSAV